MPDVKILAFVGALLAGCFATYTITHRLDNARIDRLTAAASAARADAIATALTQQKTMLDRQRTIAVAEATAERVVVTKTVTLTNEVIRHVPVDRACPSVGFVRMLDAAASGAASVDDLPLPGGILDTTCAPIDYRTLAKIIVGNYGLYQSLATRYDALAVASTVKPTP